MEFEQCTERIRIVCRSFPEVRKRLVWRGGDGIIPEGLDATLVCRAAARWGRLTDDLGVGTCPGPQKMVQLHVGER